MPNKQQKIGVLLINLGSPQSPESKDVKFYLKEFLSDRRIVDLPAWKWMPILHGIILTTRPSKSSAKYKKIWSKDGSPLLLYGKALAEALDAELDAKMPGKFHVQLAMRYGQPSVMQVMQQFERLHIAQVLVIPLYPQYSSTTTASALDAVFNWAQRAVAIPELRILNNYYNDEGYINAIANLIKKHWRDHGKGEKLVISYHGIPKSLVERGDPYEEQCYETSKLLANALSLSEKEYMVTFQSRFGKDEWLKPATQDTLESLAKDGVKSVDVVCPGFAADCLETLEEIDMECREAFLTRGGEHFGYMPCLNADPLWVQALTMLVEQHTKHWNK